MCRQIVMPLTSLTCLQLKWPSPLPDSQSLPCCRLRSKLTHAFALLRTYQHKVRVIDAAKHAATTVTVAQAAQQQAMAVAQSQPPWGPSAHAEVGAWCAAGKPSCKLQLEPAYSMRKAHVEAPGMPHRTRGQTLAMQASIQFGSMKIAALLLPRACSHPAACCLEHCQQLHRGQPCRLAARHPIMSAATPWARKRKPPTPDACRWVQCELPTVR